MEDNRFVYISTTQNLSRCSSKLSNIESNPYQIKLTGSSFEVLDHQEWIECEDYWINTSPQGSDAWKKARIGRLTMSNAGSATNMGYDKPEEIAPIIAGIKEKKFSEFALNVMRYGTETEPEAREWYEKVKGVTVKELGLVVPKWNPFIGSSVDGELEDGIIEIKCPKIMYNPLEMHTLRLQSGWIPDKYYHGHIKDCHYCQMQGGMAILGKQWCDYVVYSPPSGKVFLDRVYFNPEFWNNTMYPRILEFLKVNLFPIYRGIPLLPNNQN